MRFLKWSVLGILGVLVFAVLAVAIFGQDLMRLGTASVSRSLCAATFVSGLEPEQVFREELKPEPGLDMLAWALGFDIDQQKREVRTTALGAFQSKAIFRPGMGCLIVPNDSSPDPKEYFETPYRRDPWGDSSHVAQDERVRAALDGAFLDREGSPSRNTKAVVVLQDGRLIAERYAKGYGPGTAIWGHSLSKSVTNALVGVLVREGRLDIHKPVPVPTWQGTNDPRSTITTDQLLRMSSGLPFDETGGPVNVMTRMLFLEPDTARYAQSLALDAAPGKTWGYSNAGFQILSRIVRDNAGKTAADTERFVHEKLFDPLGMTNATIELDAVGTPFGASHVYATARDWARFGQLYLDDGLAGEQRILPEGWAAYSASQTLKTGYGAGFWTNRLNEGSVPHWGAPWGMPSLPGDMYYARGYLGQFIIIVPSERLVVVRMGLTHGAGGTGTETMVKEVISALRSARAENRPGGTADAS